MGRYRMPFTLYKRGKYWYYRTYDARGVRTVAKSTGKTTKNAAQFFCNELFKNKTLIQNEITFGEYATGFFDKNSIWIKDKARQLKESTRVSYCQALKNIMPYLEHKKLISVTQTELKVIRQELKKKYVNSNINYIFIVTGLIFKQAYLDNIIQKNPFEYLDALPVELNQRDALTRDEIKKIYLGINPQYKDAFTVLALTGCRCAECVGLIEDDIKKTENGIEYIYLYHQKQANEYSALKNNKPRNIPLIQELKPCIYKYSFNYAALYKWITQEIRKIPTWETRKLCAHSIRHFVITDAKAFGINPLIVETVVGHSLRGIQQVYTNFNIEQLQEFTNWQKDLYNFLNK